MKRISSLTCVLFCFSIIGCTSAPPKYSVSASNNDTLLLQSKISQLEKEKLELELRNSILTRALADKKQKTIKAPRGQPVQPFPQFDELIYDQAQSAYKTKDEERLTEALRILKTNQPSSKYLETMFFWLAQLQQDKAKYNQALITYNEFLKNYPSSTYASQAAFLKGSIYEKLNLKDQALQIYKEIRLKYPHSREKHFADSKVENMTRE